MRMRSRIPCGGIQHNRPDRSAVFQAADNFRLAEEHPVDDILLVYGLSSLAEDKNLQWLA